MNVKPIAFSFDIASLAPDAVACMVRIVRAVAVAADINITILNQREEGLLTCWEHQLQLSRNLDNKEPSERSDEE